MNSILFVSVGLLSWNFRAFGSDPSPALFHTPLTTFSYRFQVSDHPESWMDPGPDSSSLNPLLPQPRDPPCGTGSFPSLCLALDMVSLCSCGMALSSGSSSLHLQRAGKTGSAFTNNYTSRPHLFSRTTGLTPHCIPGLPSSLPSSSSHSQDNYSCL